MGHPVLCPEPAGTPRPELPGTNLTGLEVVLAVTDVTEGLWKTLIRLRERRPRVQKRR
jgi:hypothetical protein